MVLGPQAVQLIHDSSLTVLATDAVYEINEGLDSAYDLYNDQINPLYPALATGHYHAYAHAIALTQQHEQIGRYSLVRNLVRTQP